MKTLAPAPSFATRRRMGRVRLRRGPRGSFADRLRAARALRGLSQDAAGPAIGVNRVTLARWETGANKPRGIVKRVVEEWIAASRKEDQNGPK